MIVEVYRSARRRSTLPHRALGRGVEWGATDPGASTLEAIQAAFEKAGVVFLEPGDARDGGPGVLLS
jgi:hypothetical protein